MTAELAQSACSAAGGSDGPILRLDNVHKHFDTLHCLRGVSLEVQRGEVVVIIGPSGSGKSTLLRCICGLEPIQEGTIYYEGRPVKGTLSLRGEIGMVFQDFPLWPHMTVLENVSLAPKLTGKASGNEARRLAEERLCEVGLQDKMEAYPGQLSGGQKQRVAIARAVAMEPTVMLFDEITSALDRELVMGILMIMKGLAEKGMTMLVVTHELWFGANAADRVVFMDEGIVVEEGTPHEIFESPTEQRTCDFIGEVSMAMIMETQGQ